MINKTFINNYVKTSIFKDVPKENLTATQFDSGFGIIARILDGIDIESMDTSQRETTISAILIAKKPSGIPFVLTSLNSFESDHSKEVKEVGGFLDFEFPSCTDEDGLHQLTTEYGVIECNVVLIVKSVESGVYNHVSYLSTKPFYINVRGYSFGEEQTNSKPYIIQNDDALGYPIYSYLSRKYGTKYE